VEQVPPSLGWHGGAAAGAIVHGSQHHMDYSERRGRVFAE
jgi:hypothetical protein